MSGRSIDRLHTQDTLSCVVWADIVAGVSCNHFIAMEVLVRIQFDCAIFAVPVTDAKGDRQTIPTSEIDQLCNSPISLMSENLCLQFKPQELCDLFAYIHSAK